MYFLGISGADGFDFGEKVDYVMGYISANWLRRRLVGWGVNWRTVWWWTRRVGYVIVVFYPFKVEFLTTRVELSSGLCFAR